jgi:DnaJ-class molecular chaperone
MKTVRTYPSGCTWCNATGHKFPMQHDGTDFSSICPVCNGAKTIIVTETVEDSEANPYLLTGDELEKAITQRK